MSAIDPELAPLLRKLGLSSQRDAEASAAIRQLPFDVEAVAADQLLVREGEARPDCCLLLDGYACRYKTTAHGGRQIVSFHMRGDLLDLQHLLLAVADHNVQATTKGRVAWIPKEKLQDVTAKHPAINAALWRDTLIDGSIFREWVLNVGKRDAKARVAHMLCEFVTRAHAAGLGFPQRFEIPITLERIADATGLTAVHTNRMVRALIADRVIIAAGQSYQVADWLGLQRVAEFNSAYLHAEAA